LTAYPLLLYLYFSFSKKYSLAIWSTCCSIDYSNIVNTTWSTQYEPLNKNKQLLHTIASIILVRFYSFFWNKPILKPVAKKVQGSQQKGTSKAILFLWFA